MSKFISYQSILALSLGLALNPGTPVFAQTNSTATEQDSSDRLVYAPAYFTQYSPLTAAEMVAQVPAFTLGGGGSGRGFSQGQGNLLINGKRPSTKANSPEEILRRIPASKVMRIEILRQGSAELAGQSGLIVNIITADDTDLRGTFVAVAISDRGVERPHFSFSVAGKKGNFDYTAEVLWDTQTFNFGSDGPETLVDAEGNLIEFRDEFVNATMKRPTLNLGMAWEGDNGHTANLNFKGLYALSTNSETSRQFAPPQDPNGMRGELSDLQRTVISPWARDRYNYEIGGDYALPLSGGTLKLIGLRTYTDDSVTSDSINDTVGGPLTEFKSKTNAITGESILRALYTIEPAAGQTVELAVEGALNTLDTTSDFCFDEGTGLGCVDFTVDGSDVRVEEQRGETSLLYSRPLGAKLKLQSTLAVEYSKLSTKGANGNSRSFLRPKGFVKLTYDPSPNIQIRARIDRRVGQLNFRSFASSVDFQDGNQDSGNTELVPQQSWSGEVALEYRLSKKNVVTLIFDQEIFEDFLTFLSFEGGGAGLGNLKTSKPKTQSISLNTTWDTDFLGLKGGKLDTSTTFTNTKFRDQITGLDRDIDNGLEWFYSVNFRQDIVRTDWAWGFNLNDFQTAPSHRTDQRISNSDGIFNGSTFFIEHKNVFGMTLNFNVRNIFNQDRVRVREFFDGDRLGDITQIERRIRKGGQTYRLTLSGKF